ncbi:MAG: hypothetical protein ACJARL_001970 [Halopseudomonas sp.]|jgi:hypothetical protein
MDDIWTGISEATACTEFCAATSLPVLDGTTARHPARKDIGAGF